MFNMNLADLKTSAFLEATTEQQNISVYKARLCVHM